MSSGIIMTPSLTLGSGFTAIDAVPFLAHAPAIATVQMVPLLAAFGEPRPTGLAVPEYGIAQFVPVFRLGGGGGEMLSGGYSSDRLDGGGGADTLMGADLRDTMFGGSGDDILFGNAGIDHLFGNEGQDWLWGGRDEDLLHGGQGNDRLWGDLGADVLSGDQGDDTLSGGADGDSFLFTRGGGHDVITDFSAAEGDRILLPDDPGLTVRAERQDGDTVLFLDDGSSLRLAGVASPAGLFDVL